MQVLSLLKLKSNESRSLDEIVTIQNKKLKVILNHAYRNVPFYRKLFDSRGIVPDDIKSAEDLSLLPIVDKTQIQKLSVEEITAANIDLTACRALMTSGTTGLPLRFYVSRRDLTIRNLICARSHLACGLKPWHKISVFGGDRRVNEKKSWYEYLGLWRRKEISSWKEPKEWAAILSQWKPDILTGRVTTLRLLAEAVLNSKPGAISPKKVFSSAGMLDTESRRFLESVFRCPVIDFYASFEGGCLAWECRECNGYHMNIDSLVMEIIRDGRPALPGEEGEVVITNLNLHAMPFIRYRQGDMVVLSCRKPVCGVNLPLFDTINGRKDDYIVLKSGRKIPPQPVPHVFIPVAGVKRWRVIQDSLDHMTVEVEPEEIFNPDQKKILIEEINKLTRGEIEVSVKIVDSIPIDPSKKFRAINSRVNVVAP